MDGRQHTLAMKRTESYICDTLNTERSSMSSARTTPIDKRYRVMNRVSLHTVVFLLLSFLD